MMIRIYRRTDVLASATNYSVARNVLTDVLNAKDDTTAEYLLALADHRATPDCEGFAIANADAIHDVEVIAVKDGAFTRYTVYLYTF